MKYIGILKCGLAVLLLVLAGCGGGSSSSSTPVDVTPLPQTTKITGIASKGLIGGGTVTAYKIINSAVSDVISSGTTGANGSYSLDLGTYTGPVLFEISGGTYTDEATGNPTTIPVTAPLHAVVSSVTGITSVAAITPLTELAYQLAGSILTATAINNANQQVSSIFKVYDVIKVLPVSPTKIVLDALPSSIQGQDQRDYTLVLATLSQVSSTKGLSVAETVNYLKNNISGAVLTTVAATALQDAAAAYFNPSNTKNTTGVTDPASTNLVYIGAKQVSVKLSTTGTIPNGNAIKGMQFEIDLPSGVSVKSDTSGVLANAQISGVAPTETSMLVGNTSGSKLSISFVNNSGIATGEFVTLVFDVANNVSIPTIGSFFIPTGYKVTDLVRDSGTVSLSAVSIFVSSVTNK